MCAIVHIIGSKHTALSSLLSVAFALNGGMYFFYFFIFFISSSSRNCSLFAGKLWRTCYRLIKCVSEAVGSRDSLSRSSSVCTRCCCCCCWGLVEEELTLRDFYRDEKPKIGRIRRRAAVVVVVLYIYTLGKGRLEKGPHLSKRICTKQDGKHHFSISRLIYFNLFFLL